MSVTDTWAEWKTDDTNKPSGLDSPEIDDELRNIKKQVKTNVMAAYGIRQYATLPAAITAIGTASAHLVIDTAVAVSTNATIPSTLAVAAIKPGIFNISSGITLTINGPVDAGPYQIFSCTGTGQVVLNGVSRVYPEWWGAVGDGTTDDAVALTAAMTNCAATGGTLVLGTKTYKFTTALAWACYSYAIRGCNTVLLASGITGFAFIAKDTKGDDTPSYLAVNKGMKGVRLTGGDSIVTGKHGLYLGDSSGATYGAAMIDFENCIVEMFDTGVEWGNNSYLQRFNFFNVRSCNQCINFPTGLTNSGESITFTNSDIFNADAGLKVVSGSFNFYGCSFDYLGEFIHASAGARVNVFGGNIEGSSDSVWVTSQNVQTFVGLYGCNVYNAHADARAYRFGLSDNYADFHVENCYFSLFTQALYPLTYLVASTDGGRVTGRNNAPHSTDSALLPILSNCLNVLSDGGFESSYTADWTSAGTAVPTLDNTDKHGGTYSLKFAPANGQLTSIRHDRPCRPGDRLQVDYWIKNTFGASPNTFSAKVLFLDRAGTELSGNAFTQTYSAAGTHYDTWTQVRLAPYGIAPVGAYTLRVEFITGTSDGVDVNRIDDVTINVH